MVSRPESSQEMKLWQAAEVDALLKASFEGDEEVQLVHRLRQDGDMAQEMVLSVEGRIAGYAALSRMRQPEGWLCLAPVAVWPEFQRGAAAPAGQGKKDWQIGRRLVSDLVAATKHPEFGGNPAIVVLGQPEFYEKCGFSRARAARLKSPYPVEYTLLAAPGSDVPAETLVYPAAFDADPADK